MRSDLGQVGDAEDLTAGGDCVIHLWDLAARSPIAAPMVMLLSRIT